MKYAETVAEIGVHPLRRRDVNAMRLALDVLRRWPPGSGVDYTPTGPRRGRFVPRYAMRSLTLLMPCPLASSVFASPSSSAASCGSTRGTTGRVATWT